jgi:EAL domain-containing protein (putative c-di-GMP-specific phosphodiesterase class I)
MKNLQVLEKKAAELAPDIDLATLNHIDNIKGMVASIQQEMSELEQGGLNVIKPAPFPLQKYEYFITKFSEEILSYNFDKDPGRYEKGLLTSLKQSTGARHVCVARYIHGEWKINGIDSSDEKEIKSKYIQSEKLNYLLNLKSQQGLYHLESAIDSKLSLLFPFGKDNSEILIFNEINNDIIYDKAFELILRTILEETNNFKNPQPAESLELSIYNNLRKNFGLVSDAIYNRQYYLFNMNLEKMSIEFEPIIFISPDAPSIFGWEALARDPKTSRAPVDLFDTADIWGVRFQLQLDMYFLNKAVELYGIDTKEAKNNVNAHRRKHIMLPLSVNVHPSSLLRRRYRETIQTISSQKFMPLNKLYLEISEKDQIPTPDDWDGKQNSIEAYRDHLNFYRDLDIHFSIDDFGIGYSSSSRVSRLGPAFVKIDRDALIDSFGNFTLSFVVSLARRLPGETRVIVEGYDEDSVLSLKKLYELGIRYIQGHKLGKTRPEIDDRLPKEIVELIQKELK